MFYVYEWYNTNTNEIFYVGKGCGNRYKNHSKRNKLFIEYYNNNSCASRIIAYYENEQDAFNAEKERIIELKSKGMCQCNLDNGGTGGVNFVWTPEMREYKSVNNPMKSIEQRERMSINNPMKNKEIAKKVGLSHRKIIIYNNSETTAFELSQLLNLHVDTVRNWAKRGYDTNGNPCYYKEETVPSIKKNTSCKAVIIDGIYFQSLRAAADFLNVKYTNPLCKALKQNRTYKGHKCEYANQQPSKGNSEQSTFEGSETNE